MISNKDRANHYRTEYDARNPRLRMNIVGFLLEKGETPLAEDADEFVEMVDKFVNYIANDVEPFAGLVEALEDDDDNQLSIDDLDDDDGKGFKYL